MSDSLYAKAEVVKYNYYRFESRELLMETLELDGKRLLIVEPKSVMNLDFSIEYRDAMEKEVVKQKPDVLIFSLVRCKWMDSSGIGTLIVLLKKMKTYGGDLVLYQPSKSIMDSLRACAMEKLFTIWNEWPQGWQVPEFFVRTSI